MISLNGVSNNNSLLVGSITSNNKTEGKFSKILEDSLNKIDFHQKVSNDTMESFIKGEQKEVHDVMIAMQEAKLSMQLAIEIRNKMIEAYQELSRIQI